MAQVLKATNVKDPAMLDRALTIGPTDRVERLRESYLDLKPAASIDRARIETGIMKETEGEPMITRRAKVFAAIVLLRLAADTLGDQLYRRPERGPDGPVPVSLL